MKFCGKEPRGSRRPRMLLRWLWRWAAGCWSSQKGHSIYCGQPRQEREQKGQVNRCPPRRGQLPLGGPAQPGDSIFTQEGDEALKSQDNLGLAGSERSPRWGVFKVGLEHKITSLCSEMWVVKHGSLSQSICATKSHTQVLWLWYKVNRTVPPKLWVYGIVSELNLVGGGEGSTLISRSGTTSSQKTRNLAVHSSSTIIRFCYWESS